MACTQSTFLELLDGMIDTLRLVANEENTVLHPYVESELFKAVAHGRG